jgi:mRNA-degrading endonuclease RelE of RelBE toxin-antitoxin system
VSKQENQKLGEKNSIEAVIKLYEHDYQGHEYEPNGNSKAPDYRLDFKSKSVLVEVVHGRSFVIKDGKYEPASFVDKELNGLCKEISKKIKKFLKSDESIILFVNKRNLPTDSQKISKIAKDIAQYIETKYKNISAEQAKGVDGGNLVNLFEKHDNSSSCQVSIKKREQGEGMLRLRFMDLGSNVSEQSCSAQAEYTLYSAIAEKAAKISNLKKEDWIADSELEKWLVIINTNPILEIDNYIEAYKSLTLTKLPHLYFFTKVFVVMRSSNSKESNSSTAYEL